MKKLISKVLIPILSVSLLAGCGGNNTPNNDQAVSETAAAKTEAAVDATEKPTEEAIAEDNTPPVVDMGGYTFVVADVNPNRWIPEEGSSDLANAILERNKWVEETYNCKIEYKSHNADEFGTAVMANDKYADIIICPTWEIGRHINGKRIIDINTMPNIDLKKSYWSDYNNINLLSYDNMIYGLGAPFASQNDEVFIVFFNKAIIEELGIENPYDLVEKNEWTFEKFLEMERAATRDLNGDGVMDHNDRYGFATGHDWDISVVMYLASGNQIITDTNGVLSYGVNTPKAFEAINMIKNMVKVGDTFYAKQEGEDMDAYVKAFVEGKALFYTYSRGRGVADPIYEMEDDFGIVPLPKWNKDSDYRCWVSHDAPSMTIPITNTDLEKTGIILEALAYRSQEENQIAFDEYALTKLRDDESVDILSEINNYAVSDLAFIGQQMVGSIYGGLGLIPNVCFYDQNAEAASSVAEVEESFDIGLEELTQKFKGTYVEPPATEESAAEDAGEEE